MVEMDGKGDSGRTESGQAAAGGDIGQKHGTDLDK